MGIFIAVVVVIIMFAIFYARARAQRVKQESRSSSQASIHRSSPAETSRKKWYPTKVTGVTYKNDDGSSRQTILGKCSNGETVDLIREPNNPHDRNAVKVCRKSGEQLGYVARDSAEMVQRAIVEEHKQPKSRILEIRKKEGKYSCVIEINYSGEG